MFIELPLIVTGNKVFVNVANIQYCYENKLGQTELYMSNGDTITTSMSYRDTIHKIIEKGATL